MAGARGAPIRARVEALDWQEIEAALAARGWAHTPPLLTAAECAGLIRLYGEAHRFRKFVDMERHRFGVGDYRYFQDPLPRLVRELRSHAYRRLAPLANRMEQALGRGRPFPASLSRFRALCRAHGQAQPTPLLLHYAAGGYNCLHRDLYGPLVFPLQMACFLSHPGRDYAGGAFLLVEQRPRSQSVGTAVTPRQGEALIFASAERPASGKRGPVRSVMRHGVSLVTRGERYTLGVIFHDAES